MIKFQINTSVEDIYKQVHNQNEIITNPKFYGFKNLRFCEIYAHLIKICVPYLQQIDSEITTKIPFLKKLKPMDWASEFPTMPMPDFEKYMLDFDVRFESSNHFFLHKINPNFDIFNVEIKDKELVKKIEYLERL